MTAKEVHVERVVDVVFDENAYIVYERSEGVCWIIDPSFEPQPRRIAAIVSERSLKPKAILLTHCHADHIAGVDPLLERWGNLEIFAPKAEASALADPDKNVSAAFGMEVVVAASPTGLLASGEVLALEDSTWKVLDTSGHSPGGLSYYCAEAKIVITGDALFAGSVGRTDLPGSNTEQLLKNLQQNLLSLPAEVIVYPGHGPSTTIGQERAANPFLRAWA